MRFLVVGAGVIGQVYAGRLHAAGHDVLLLARAPQARALAERGVLLAEGDRTVAHLVRAATDPPIGAEYDYALLAVRHDQLGAALAVAWRAGSRHTATLCNITTGAGQLQDSGRVVLAFPGVGGRTDPDGAVHYAHVRQQPTTLATGDASTALAAALRGAGFPVALERDMPAWLTTHAVFIAGVSAAILLHGGDSAALGADRIAAARMVRAIGQGFRALRRSGIRPAPGPLRAIFTTVPGAFAVPYWQRQLAGPVGIDTIAPHARATWNTELPVIAQEIRSLIGAEAPEFIALLTEAGLLTAH